MKRSEGSTLEHVEEHEQFMSSQCTNAWAGNRQPRLRSRVQANRTFDLSLKSRFLQKIKDFYRHFQTGIPTYFFYAK